MFDPILLFFLGLIAGSFISVLIDRIPKGEEFVKSRSRCPECKNVIKWYDNIPLVSYVMLRARCRSCKGIISPSYPLLEAFMAFSFVGIYHLGYSCSLESSAFCDWNSSLASLALPFNLLLFTILVATFIIDFRHQIIPDVFSLSLLSIVFVLLVFGMPDNLYINSLVGFGISSFLLSIHLITKGKGMGLGDVKLVIPLGMILGYPHALTWISASFVIGAIVGLILIFAKLTKFGKHIAFGPFLIIAFILIYIASRSYLDLLVPLQ